jgi:hypothetical protein
MNSSPSASPRPERVHDLRAGVMSQWKGRPGGEGLHAERANTDIDLVTGEEVERILKQSFATPPALIQGIQTALGRQ